MISQNRFLWHYYAWDGRLKYKYRKHFNGVKFNESKKTNFDVLQASLEDFEKLKKKYSWGSNAFYHFAANNNINTTYVQTMQNDSRYNSSDILTFYKDFHLKILQVLVLQR